MRSGGRGAPFIKRPNILFFINLNPIVQRYGKGCGIFGCFMIFYNLYNPVAGGICHRMVEKNRTRCPAGVAGGICHRMVEWSWCNDNLTIFWGFGNLDLLFLFSSYIGIVKFSSIERRSLSIFRLFQFDIKWCKCYSSDA